MKYIVSIFLLSSLVVSASAQITFNAADYINLVTAQSSATWDTAVNASVLLPIIGQSGPNQTWDFTVASFNFYEGMYTSSVFLPYSTSIVGATDSGFSSANYVNEFPAYAWIADGKLWHSYASNIFYKINSSGDWNLGNCQDSDGMVGTLNYLDPPMELSPFPLTYQTTWQSTSKQIGPDFSYQNSSITDINEVDGYGTLILPNYSGNALRVKVTQITRDSGQGFYADDTTYGYSFYTLDGYQASINFISGTTLDGTIFSVDTFASYFVPSNSSVNSLPVATSGLSLSISQNPASSAGTNIIFTLPNAASTQIELMDALGRSVRMIESGFEGAGTHSLPIDATSLASGTYFVRLQTGDESAMQKLVIE